MSDSSRKLAMGCPALGISKLGMVALLADLK
jgi:hypothetical protein